MFMEMLCRVKLVVALVIIQIEIIVLGLQRNTGCVLIAGRPTFMYICDETTRVLCRVNDMRNIIVELFRV
jgi:hypothetical protein